MLPRPIECVTEVEETTMSDPTIRRTTPNPFQFRPIDPKNPLVPNVRRADPPKPNVDPTEEGRGPRRPTPESARASREQTRRDEDALRRKIELQGNAQVIDRNFRAFDSTQGDNTDGKVSRGDLERLSNGTFDRGNA